MKYRKFHNLYYYYDDDDKKEPPKFENPRPLNQLESQNLDSECKF